ncbi:MAG: phosphatase PAP2 family protein [Gemmatimonadota bacterium]
MAKAIKERREIPRGHLSLIRGALYSTLRFIAKHIRGFYGALAAFVTVSLVVGAAAVSTFAAFASLVTGGFTQAFDERVLQWLEGRRSPVMDRVMVEISALGTGATLLVLVLVASVFLWLTKHHWSVYILLMGVFGGQLMNRLLKTSFERPRPSIVDAVADVSSLSFPSGHAMTSMITYGSVAYLVARLEPTRRLRLTTWSLCAVMIILIGISRMYLGVHYPSDIIAGYLGGIAWLAFVAASLTAVRFFSPRRPETKKEEKDLQAEAQREAGVRA